MHKYDRDGTLSYCLGTTICFELLFRKPHAARAIYVSPKQKRDGTYAKLASLAKKNGIPLIENNEKIFRLGEKSNVMAIGEFEKFSSKLDPGKNHIVLVNPSNMGNLGTVLRSAAAFSIGGLAIIRPAADAFDPKCVRSSMGAIFSVPFAYFDSFDEYRKAAGQRSYYPFMLKAKTSLKNAKAKKPCSLVFGNEATGLDDSFLGLGTPLRIPQSSAVDSLNLDNAVSIGLYALLS